MNLLELVVLVSCLLAFAGYRELVARPEGGSRSVFECGALKVLGRGTASPTYAADTDFTVEIPLKRGIAKRIIFDWRGTTTGTVTTVRDDAPGTLITSIQAEFPKREGGSYAIKPIAFRDLRLTADWLNGRAPRRSASAAAAAMYETVDLPLYAAVPGREPGFDQGIDIDEIGGEQGTKLLIAGRYGPATDFGAGATGFTSGTLRVIVLGDVNEPHDVPRWALLPASKKILTNNGDTKYEEVLNKGDLHLAFALMLRAHDFSGIPNDRINGLFAKFTVEHPDFDVAWADYWMHSQERALALFRIANGDAFAAKPAGLDGTTLLVFNEDLYLGMFPRLPGADLKIELDAETAELTGITGVTPAASDFCQATLLGLQGNRKALEDLARR